MTLRSFPETGFRKELFGKVVKADDELMNVYACGITVYLFK